MNNNEIFTSVKAKSCCFTGHREHKLNLAENGIEALKEALFTAIEHLCKNGVSSFYTGLAEGVDLWSALAVITLKKTYPLKLHGVIPFNGQESSWDLENRAEYSYVTDHCDTVHTISQTYNKFCYFQRNQYIVDHSDLTLAVYNGAPGGTKFTIDYAQKKNKKIIILNPKTLELKTLPQQISFDTNFSQN